jgi:hypothetical protein
MKRPLSGAPVAGAPVRPAKRRRTVPDPPPPPAYAGWDIAIAFSGPYRPVVVTTPYPNPVTVRGTTYRHNAVSIHWCQGREELADIQGVYVVQNGSDPVYAGEAKTRLRTRYRNKAAGVQELGLTGDLTAQRQSVWAGEVNCGSVDLFTAIHMVEHWLIRYLLVRDFTRNPNNRKIVNIDKTGQGTAPASGMKLAFTTPVGMDFLWDPQLTDLANNVVAAAGGTDREFTYEYLPAAGF